MVGSSVRSSASRPTTGQLTICETTPGTRSPPPANRSTKVSSTASQSDSTYVSGDFADQQTYARVAHALGDARNPVFYLEIPPSLFATVVKGLAGAGLVGGARRVVVEKPFGHDLESARALAAELHRYAGRTADLPHRPLPGKDRAGRDPLPALRQLDARAGVESQLPWLGPDHHGRGRRRGGPRALLRPRWSAARRGRQPPPPSVGGGGDGGTRGHGS